MIFNKILNFFKPKNSHIDWEHIFFSKINDIESYLKELKIFNYKLIEHEKYGFIVDVHDSVDISFLNLSKIHVKFNKIYGNFNCSNNKLKTLLGCPDEVKGTFSCFNNKLKNLEYSPKIVHKDYICFSNQLASLYGAPHEIPGDFYCSFNQLLSLEYSPKIVKGDYNCSSNMIDSLWGSPKVIGKTFDCSDNSLKNLEYTPALVYGHYIARQNPIETLEFLPEKVNKNIFIDTHNFLSLKTRQFETLNQLIELQEKEKISSRYHHMNSYLERKENKQISIKI